MKSLLRPAAYSIALSLLLVRIAAAQGGTPPQGATPPVDPMAPVEGGSEQNPPSEPLPEYKETPEEKPARSAPPRPPAKPPRPKPKAPTAAPPDDREGRGVKVGGDEAAATLKRPIRAVIHKEAKDWEPVSLREGGDPGQSATAVSLKLVKIDGRLKGENTKARAFARTYKGPKQSTWLVVSVFPKSLEKKHIHLEVRFRIFEGFIEEIAASAITVEDRAGRGISPSLRDSFELREQGVEFTEDRPGSGAVIVSALDPRPVKGAFNAGRLEKAEFPSRDLGFVNMSWSVRGPAPRAR